MSIDKKNLFPKKIIYIFILLIVFILLFIVLNKKKSNIETKITQTSSVVAEFDPIFNEIYQKIDSLDKEKISIEKPEPFTHLNWTEGNIDLGMIESDYALDISIIENKTTEINKSLHQKIAKNIESILIKNGFKLDKTNTLDNINPPSFLNFVYGYKSDKLSCLVESNSSVFISKNFNSFLTFSCFQNDKFQKTYKEQYPYILALQEAGEYEPIGNITIENNSALIYLTNSKLNAYLHKNKKGKWVFIMKNQDFLCKDLEEKGVPKKDLVDCMNDDGSYYGSN